MLFNVFLPKPLYQALPAIYVAAGVIILLAFESPIAYVPAVLLVLAGAITWTWRSQHRSSKRSPYRRKASARGNGTSYLR